MRLLNVFIFKSWGQVCGWPRLLWKDLPQDFGSWLQGFGLVQRQCFSLSLQISDLNPLGQWFNWYYCRHQSLFFIDQVIESWFISVIIKRHEHVFTNAVQLSCLWFWMQNLKMEFVWKGLACNWVFGFLWGLQRKLTLWHTDKMKADTPVPFFYWGSCFKMHSMVLRWI